MSTKSIMKLFKSMWFDTMPPLLNLYAVEFPAVAHLFAALQTKKAFQIDVAYDENKVAYIWAVTFSDTKNRDIAYLQKIVTEALQIKKSVMVGPYDLELAFTKADLALLFKSHAELPQLLQMLSEW